MNELIVIMRHNAVMRSGLADVADSKDVNGNESLGILFFCRRVRLPGTSFALIFPPENCQHAPNKHQLLRSI